MQLRVGLINREFQIGILDHRQNLPPRHRRALVHHDAHDAGRVAAHGIFALRRDRPGGIKRFDNGAFDHGGGVHGGAEIMQKRHPDHHHCPHQRRRADDPAQRRLVRKISSCQRNYKGFATFVARRRAAQKRRSLRCGEIPIEFMKIGRRTTAWARTIRRNAPNRRVRLPLPPRRWIAAQRKRVTDPGSLGRA